MSEKNIQQRLEQDNQTTPEHLAQRDDDTADLSRQMGQYAQKHGVAAASKLFAQFLLQMAENYEAKTMDVTVPMGKITVMPNEVKPRVLH